MASVVEDGRLDILFNLFEFYLVFDFDVCENLAFYCYFLESVVDISFVSSQ